MDGRSLNLLRLLCGVLLILVLFATAAGGGVESLRVYRQNDRLRLDLRASELLDERTASTIDSGLQGTCVYSFTLEERNGKRVGERLLELSLRLDLWENLYRLECPEAKLDFPSLAAADSAWSDLRAVDLCSLRELRPGVSYRVEVRVAVQPLGAADRARLSRYVKSNSSRKREELVLDLGEIFGRLLGASSARTEHGLYTGPYFQLEDLEVEP